VPLEPLQDDDRQALAGPAWNELRARREDQEKARPGAVGHSAVAGELADQELAQLERRRVGPLQVLDHQHRRALLGGVTDQRHERLQRQILPALGRYVRDQTLVGLRQPEQLAEEGRGLGQGQIRQGVGEREVEGFEQLDDGTERARLVLGKAAAREPAVAGGQAVTQLACQARLADAGLARDEHGAWRAGVRRAPALRELLKRSVAPDERRLGRGRAGVLGAGLAPAPETERG
jgi:hypothetical protein